MATRGRSITLTTSYQTAFDASTDGGPAEFGIVSAIGNDVTAQVTRQVSPGVTATDEYLTPSGYETPLLSEKTGGAYHPVITKIEVKAASAAGTAYVNVGPRTN